MAQKPDSPGPVSSVLELNRCPSCKEPGKYILKAIKNATDTNIFSHT